MNPDKVVMHYVNRDGGNVIFEFLGKPIREPSESPHRHAHREVLALHKASADMPRVGIASYFLALTTQALSGAVALLPLRRVSIDLHKLGIVNIATKGGGCTSILLRASPLLIHGKSRMRRRAYEGCRHRAGRFQSSRPVGRRSPSQWSY
jgi:hypothetical protein